VFCLGDNFHDTGGATRLEPYAGGMLDALTRVIDWVWVAGNHDQGQVPCGTAVEELEISGVMLRHEALAGESRPELSGHYHPKLRISARGRSVARPCAVASERKLILPAFGALTGGMDAADPAIINALQPMRAADALLGVQGRLVQYPIWRAANR
jgi:metallophosphoesterase superfamily enzyme